MAQWRIHGGGGGGGGTGGTYPPPLVSQYLASPRIYAYGSHAKTGAGSYIYTRARVLLHQSAELQKNTPFRLQLTQGQETRPPCHKTEVCTSDHLRIHLRGPKFQNFPGGACPQTPLLCVLRALPRASCPPFSSFWIRP